MLSPSSSFSAAAVSVLASFSGWGAWWWSYSSTTSCGDREHYIGRVGDSGSSYATGSHVHSWGTTHAGEDDDRVEHVVADVSSGKDAYATSLLDRLFRNSSPRSVSDHSARFGEYLGKAHWRLYDSFWTNREHDFLYFVWHGSNVCGMISMGIAAVFILVAVQGCCTREKPSDRRPLEHGSTDLGAVVNGVTPVPVRSPNPADISAFDGNGDAETSLREAPAERVAPPLAVGGSRAAGHETVTTSVDDVGTLVAADEVVQEFSVVRGDAPAMCSPTRELPLAYAAESDPCIGCTPVEQEVNTKVHLDSAMVDNSGFTPCFANQFSNPMLTPELVHDHGHFKHESQTRCFSPAMTETDSPQTLGVQGGMDDSLTGEMDADLQIGSAEEVGSQGSSFQYRHDADISPEQACGLGAFIPAEMSAENLPLSEAYAPLMSGASSEFIETAGMRHWEQPQAELGSPNPMTPFVNLARVASPSSDLPSPVRRRDGNEFFANSGILDGESDQLRMFLPVARGVETSFEAGICPRTCLESRYEGMENSRSSSAAGETAFPAADVDSLRRFLPVDPLFPQAGVFAGGLRGRTGLREAGAMDALHPAGAAYEASPYSEGSSYQEDDSFARDPPARTGMSRPWRLSRPPSRPPMDE